MGGNMQFNLFTWIREGVKRSVLLGFSDAIDTIGTPDVESKINQQLFPGVDQKMATTTGRKRLGRSLKDMNDAPAKTVANRGA